MGLAHTNGGWYITVVGIVIIICLVVKDMIKPKVVETEELAPLKKSTGKTGPLNRETGPLNPTEY